MGHASHLCKASQQGKATHSLVLSLVLSPKYTCPYIWGASLGPGLHALETTGFISSITHSPTSTTRPEQNHISGSDSLSGPWVLLERFHP